MGKPLSSRKYNLLIELSLLALLAALAGVCCWPSRGWGMPQLLAALRRGHGVCSWWAIILLRSGPEDGRVSGIISRMLAATYLFIP